MDIRKKLQDLGYDLPSPAPAAAQYVPYVISGSHLFISGQIPFLNGETMHLGRLGENISIEAGQEAAQACALNILAQADKAVNGDSSLIRQCVKLGGFVHCTPEFTDHSKVINGASELLIQVMGDAGRHTRFAVGAPSLPFGVAVEIEAVFNLNT